MGRYRTVALTKAVRESFSLIRPHSNDQYEMLRRLNVVKKHAAKD
jgi:hypothetical protein